MKSIIFVALALVATAAAATTYQEPVKIIKSNFEQQPEGSYSFNYESEDGSVRKEVGQVKEAFDEENKPHNVVVVSGSYSYPSVDGIPETVQYYADETGFHAEGPSIPKPARR